MNTDNLLEDILTLYLQGTGKKTIGKLLGISEWQVRKAIKNSNSNSKNKGKKIKRLFFDIETSYNIVKSWRIGYNLNINPDDIIQERAIICVCYKWEGESTIHSLSWNNGDDRDLVDRFMSVIQDADELVGHNLEEFDLKFLLTRAIRHGIHALPKYNVYDTYKKAKKHFNFNSNKLEYIAKFLGVGSKLPHEGLKMWDSVILDKDKAALDKMLAYCKQDVVITEKVFEKLRVYTEHNTNHATMLGEPTANCPNDGSYNFTYIKKLAMKSGAFRHLLKCNDCGQKYSISQRQYSEHTHLKPKK